MASNTQKRKKIMKKQGKAQQSQPQSDAKRTQKNRKY